MPMDVEFLLGYVSRRRAFSQVGLLVGLLLTNRRLPGLSTQEAAVVVYFSGLRVSRQIDVETTRDESCCARKHSSKSR
jgi:hypothetical protein